MTKNAFWEPDKPFMASGTEHAFFCLGWGVMEPARPTVFHIRAVFKCSTLPVWPSGHRT